MKAKIQRVVLVGLLTLFLISVFKNIARPLLWNDEAVTAMFATRVLTYGYPKVHDGKNVLNFTEIPDKSVGVKEKYDAWIHVGWAQDYFAAIGVYISSYFDDFYVKTAILRIPFALAGVIGVLLFPFVFLDLFEDDKHKYTFLILYLFLETLSVFLALYVREVRHYSLTLFFTLVILFIFVRYHFFLRGKAIYYLLIPFFMFLVFNTFFPVFTILISYLGLTVSIRERGNLKKCIVRLLPFLISGVLVLPLIRFYEIFYVSGEVAKYFVMSVPLYFQNVIFVFKFFFRYEVLVMMLTLKVFPYILVSDPKGFFKKMRGLTIFRVSSFLTVFCIFYTLLIAKMPYLFERYLLSLQPVLVSVVILDFFIMNEALKREKNGTKVAAMIFVAVFVFSSIFKVNIWLGRIYELFHHYEGPMDYVIPYLAENYRDPTSLVIATNYEEGVYMYYLGSKVTVGFVGNNLEEDSKVQPDINLILLNELMSRDHYREVTFPIYDYQFNNIAELSLPIAHLFKTKYAQTDEEKFRIYVKEDSN